MAALRRPSKHATRFAWTKSSTPRPLRSQAPPARPGDAPPSWVKLQLAPPEGALQPSKSQRKCWGRRPPNFSWFSRTLYFNLLSLYVVVVGHLTKYEWYKIFKWRNNLFCILVISPLEDKYRVQNHSCNRRQFWALGPWQKVAWSAKNLVSLNVCTSWL